MYLQFAKVLWEEDSVGSALLEKAFDTYSKGPQLSQDDLRREKQFLVHKLLGMQDDVDTPYMFLRHLGVFLSRASNLWFEVLHNEFSKPFYLAVPEIKERDPEYYEHLDILPSHASSLKKIEASQWIAQKLFESKI